MLIYKHSLTKIISGNDLQEAESFELMLEILNGLHSSERIAALLAALSCKGESMTEVKGFFRAMRKMSVKLKTKKRVVDTCGTGGDGSNTFNISTTSAFVTAGAGVTVAKHHNRAVSSRSGSADLLEALGIDINLPLDRVEFSVNHYGIGFCFAPLFHPSMKHAAPARKALGIRTIFNILGPLLNPFEAKRQVLGIFAKEKMHFVAELLSELDSEKVLIVHGSDGLDEATLTGSTFVVELDHGAINEYKIDPQELGFNLYNRGDFRGGDANANAEITRKVLNGHKGPERDIVILNAALAIYTGVDGLCLKDAVELAQKAIRSGAAKNKLNVLIDMKKEVQPA